MSIFHTGWYLIYTKPRHEKKVFQYLRECDIDCFLPTRKVLRVWHDRKKYVDEPLFPSYIFIYLKDRQSYISGIDADGVLYYVRNGKDMARVQESVINNIKVISGQSSFPEVTGERFEPGRKLVINDGALTGLSCEVVNAGNKEMLLVRVDLLKRNILLSVPAEHLMEI